LRIAQKRRAVCRRQLSILSDFLIKTDSFELGVSISLVGSRQNPTPTKPHFGVISENRRLLLEWGFVVVGFRPRGFRRSGVMTQWGFVADLDFKYFFEFGMATQIMISERF